MKNTPESYQITLALANQDFSYFLQFEVKIGNPFYSTIIEVSDTSGQG